MFLGAESGTEERVTLYVKSEVLRALILLKELAFEEKNQLDENNKRKQ